MDEQSPLLARVTALLEDPQGSREMIELALECHAAMLGLAESDQVAAIRLALAGSRLLRVLPNREQQPAWVSAHEEQCCRYGAIWIHSLAREGHSLDPGWIQEALILLERMQELHKDPVAWAEVIRGDLAAIQTVVGGSTLPGASSTAAIAPREDPAEASLAGSDDHRIVVVGNCQSYPLYIGLRQALPQALIHFCRPVHMATAEDVGQLHQRLASADLLVAQRVQPGYRQNIGLDTPTLRGLLPAGARALILPNLHYEGCHPWISYAHDPDGQLAQREQDSPLGAYHDFLAMVAAARGLELEALLNPQAPPAVLEAVRSAHQQSLKALRQRENDCCVGLADWIEANVRSQPIGHTINHPTLASLDQLLRRLLQFLDLSHDLGPGLFDAHEHLGQLSIPVHPWVRQALDLGDWSAHWGQRQGDPLPIQQQLEQSLRFYRQNPWIAAANTSHTKFRAAESCLDHLAAAPASASAAKPQSRPEPPVTLLHLHGFKCAGSTLIWALERAMGRQLAYMESPLANQRLPWQRVRSHLEETGERPLAVTSHLITLPPAGALAQLCVAFLRDPWARILSAYRFERDVNKTLNGRSLNDYVLKFCQSPLCNYQTSQLSPQPLGPANIDRPGGQGWAASPEQIDLQRQDLFFGLVERCDESIVALEYQLEQLGTPLDLAYPGAMNTTSTGLRATGPELPDPDLRHRFLAAAALDVQLHQQAAALLDERLAAIPNLLQRMGLFQERCEQLRLQPPQVRPRPYEEWTLLN